MIDHGRSEWSLVFFTILTQMAVGAFVVWGLLVVFLPSPNPFNRSLFPVILLYTVLACLILGALSAVTHLGRPIGAVFSLSNLRKSWLSREAVLAAFFGLAVLAALFLQFTSPSFGLANQVVIVIGIIAGFSLVWGISRLYQLRTVPAWNNPATPLSFLTTSLLTGIITVRMIWFVQEILEPDFAGLAIVALFKTRSHWLVYLLVLIQAVIFGILVIYLTQQGGAGAESVRILWTKYRIALILRWMAAAVGILLLNFGVSLGLNLAAFGLLLASEVAGRFLFYAFYQRQGF